MRFLVDTRAEHRKKVPRRPERRGSSQVTERPPSCYKPAVLYRHLGASGLEVSVVGLGSWLTIGNTVEAKAAHRLVRAAFDRGVNLFDTADVYNRGEGEKALGAAITGLPRHHLVLATKCFFPMSDKPNDRGLSRKHVHESLTASLRRLGTDYVDLYQCHRFDPGTPLLETAMAMDDLIRRGLVLYWGVSQWPAERIAEVADLCRTHGLHRPISNQPLYNLFDRGVETAVLPACALHGLGLLAYSPLAQGVLTGKYRPGAPPPAGSRATDARSNQFVGRYLTEAHLEKAEQLTALAVRRGISAAQMALAFCLRDVRVGSVLVGARDETQLLDNLSAVGIPVDDDLARELDGIFPVVVG
jgi:aryl-alcohol dehydrogenase-like predicted oxidoreductase